MRTLVVGAGSIGSRRARLLAEMGHEVCVYDTNTAASMLAQPGGGQFAMGRTAAMAWGPDVVLVCTPADTHVRIAFDCVQAEHTPRGIFIEKPLSVDVAGLHELAAVCENLGIVTMGACNMRYAYRAIPRNHPPQEMGLLTSRPLSQWRPGATASYAGNGIVLESAIHDIDLATYFLGPIESVEVVAAEDGFVDMVTRHPGGRFAGITNDWRETAEVQRLAYTTNERGRPRYTYLPDTSDAMYREEMAEFLAAVEKGRPEDVGNCIRSATETLGWALRVRGQAMGVRA